jgi:outer membrane usher protein
MHHAADASPRHARKLLAFGLLPIAGILVGTSAAARSEAKPDWIVPAQAAKPAAKSDWILPAPASKARAAKAAPAARSTDRSARDGSRAEATNSQTATRRASRSQQQATLSTQPATDPQGRRANRMEDEGLTLIANRNRRGPSSISDRQTQRQSPRQTRTREPVSFPVPLIDVSAQLAEVTITLMPDESVQVRTEGLLDGLRRTLEPRAVEQLEAVIRGRPSVAPSDLSEAGITLRWNQERFVLEVDIPAQMRRVRNLSLVDASVDSETAPTVQPARLSAYVNADTAIATDLENGGDASVSVQLDGAVRMGGLVFESEASFSSTGQSDSQFQRLGSRLVYDDRVHSLRWTLGDVSAPSRGFQGGLTTAGLAVFRNYAQLQPQQLVRRRGEREFSILRESTVDAFVNNRQVRRFRLAPGTYNLSDIPVGNGVNDVRIVIADDTGTQNSIEFNLFLDRTLLDPGRNEFALSAGIGRDFDGEALAYDDQTWSVTGSYRQGILPRLTLGANVQASFEPETGPADGGSDRTTSLAGIEALYASPVGQLGVDIAASSRSGRFSFQDREGEGFAVNASLVTALDLGRLPDQSVSLVYEYRSEDFVVPGGGEIGNPVESRFGVSWSTGLDQGSFLSLDARHAIFRNGEDNSTSASISYGRRLFGSMSLTASGTYSSAGGDDAFAWRLALTRRLGRDASARIDHDFETETTRLGLQQARGSGVGSHNLALDLETAPGRTGATLAGSYLANRFEAGADLSRVQPEIGEASSRLALRLGSALVYADGAMAVSRPVSDGFAILVPHKTLEGSRIRMGQNTDTTEGTSGFLGGAVEARLSAFAPRRINYSVPDAPAGYDIGSGEVVLSPLYRSGYRVVIGSDYTMTVLGRLIGSDGQPRALVAGNLMEEAAPDRAPITLLTNREGTFGVTGLRPGHWVLTFGDDDVATYLIHVPRSDQSIVRVGDVRPIVVQQTARLAR